MFTGIVEEMGTVQDIQWGANSCRMTIRAREILKDVKLGDSIAVNGICLTVTTFSKAAFSVDVMPETLKKTSLRALHSGDAVNLERALQAGGRLGGHFVSGHIDGIGEIAGVKKEENAVLFTILAPPTVMRYIIPKGSIAIDGTSLTVVSCTDDTFIVSLIPHTRGVTVLGQKSVGDIVNLESDMIAKYLDKLLHGGEEQQRSQRGISMEKLVENGFI